jgi:hypothetical protein
MEVCRIHLSADKNIPVLSTTDQPLRVGIFNEADNTNMTYARIGRVLHGVEIARDLSALYALGISLGVHAHGNPKLSCGRLEDHVQRNCIVVSFGEGQEYIVYCIHKGGDSDIYRLYEAIQEVARTEPVQDKVLA